LWPYSSFFFSPPASSSRFLVQKQKLVQYNTMRRSPGESRREK
jgi:hypothetical protein